MVRENRALLLFNSFVFQITPRVSEVNTECFKNKTQALTIKNHGASRVNSRDFIKSDSYEVRLYIIIYILYHLRKLYR